MTKLSEIRSEADKDDAGEWFRWRGTICFRVRRQGTREHMRAVRTARYQHPQPENGATPEQKALHDEQIGAALVPSVAANLLTDWWGMDEEVDPVALEMPTVKVVGELGGEKLETAIVDGKHYRRDGARWQEMIPYTVDAAVRVLSDPKCSDALDSIVSEAQAIEVRKILRDAASLGKPRTSSSGVSATATTPRR